MDAIIAILEIYRLAAVKWRVMENLCKNAVLLPSRNGIAVVEAMKGENSGGGFCPGRRVFFTPKLKNVAGRQNNRRLGGKGVILLWRA